MIWKQGTLYGWKSNRPTLHTYTKFWNSKINKSGERLLLLQPKCLRLNIEIYSKLLFPLSLKHRSYLCSSANLALPPRSTLHHGLVGCALISFHLHHDTLTVLSKYKSVCLLCFFKPTRYIWKTDGKNPGLAIVCKIALGMVLPISWILITPSLLLIKQSHPYFPWWACMPSALELLLRIFLFIIALVILHFKHFYSLKRLVSYTGL